MVTALAVALAVVTLAAAIAIVVLVARLYAARAAADAGKLATTEAGEVNTSLVEANTRLEAVISRQKADIAALEADLDACSDPAAVRERLRRVLQADDREGAGPSVPARPAP